MVGRPGAGGTFLHAGSSRVADVGLRTESVLAVLSAQPTVVVSVSREIDARPHAGPRAVLAVRVDLHRAERSAERGGRIAPVAVVAHGDAGLVDLAAEVPARTSVGADVQNRVSVDILVLRAVLHAHSSGVVGIRPGRAVERAQLGGVVAPIAVAAVLLALASPRIAVLDVRRGVGAGGHAEPAVGVSVVPRRGASEHTHVAFSVVVGQGRADRDALVGGVISKGKVGAGALRHALEGVVEGEGALALEQALSGGVVGVVVRSGRVRAGSGAGSGERLGEVVGRTSAGADASGVEVVAVSAGADGASSDADARGVVSVASRAGVGADRSVVEPEGAVGAPERAQPREVVRSVGGVLASRLALPALRVAVEDRRSARGNVVRLADGHAKLAVPVTVVEDWSLRALEHKHPRNSVCEDSRRAWHAVRRIARPFGSCLREVLIAVEPSGAAGKAGVVADISVRGIRYVPESPVSGLALVEAVASVEVRVLRRAALVLRYAPACACPVGLPIPAVRTSDHAPVAVGVGEEPARTGAADPVHLVLVGVVGAIGHASSLVRESSVGAGGDAELSDVGEGSAGG